MYTPNPKKLDDIALPEDLLALTELIAENVHEVWAASRVAQGWTYGPVRDDAKKETPCLVPYADLPEEEKAKLQGLPTSLPEALDALEKDNDYLTADGVFPKELIANFIKSKREECRQVAAIPHPDEFDKYFNR